MPFDAAAVASAPHQQAHQLPQPHHAAGSVADGVAVAHHQKHLEERDATGGRSHDEQTQKLEQWQREQQKTLHEQQQALHEQQLLQLKLWQQQQPPQQAVNPNP